MSVWRSIKAEYHFHFGNWKRLIPIVAIFLVPILYAGTFLWAFWDPYGNLSHMPVAVVNLDRGAIENGQSLDAGQQLVNNLKSNRVFNWKFVSERQAENGLRNNQYFMVLEIPANFSQRVANAPTVTGNQPQLICITNDKYNYIASIIGKNAAEQLKAQTAENIAQTYATHLVSGIQQLEQGVQKASGAANHLASGVSQLGQNGNSLVGGASKISNGSSSLVSGLAQTEAGAKQVTQGAKAVYGGSERLNNGLGQLAAGGAQLTQGANATLDGMSKLESGVEQSTKGANQVAAGASQLSLGLQQYAQAHPEVQSDPSFQALLQGSKQVASGTQQLAKTQSKLGAGAAQVQKGQTQLTTGLQQFVGKLTEVQQGSQLLVNQEPSLISGAVKLQNGLASLESGAVQLNNGAGVLSNGIAQFANGISRLQQGSGTMASSLKQAAKQMPAVHKVQVVSATSNPVGLQQMSQGNISNYGQGFTPYFLSLGLFVGALLMTIVVSFRNPADTPKSPLAWFTAKFVLVASVSLVQSLIADWILLKGLGLHVGDAAHFILFSLLTSVTFVAIIQFLVTSLADPGRFIAVIMLILQLTSSSGTYPVILSPKFFQDLHPYLPMTYSVDGFRYLIGGGNAAFMRSDIWSLTIYAIAFMTLSLLYFTLRYWLTGVGKSPNKTQPEIAGQDSLTPQVLS